MVPIKEKYSLLPRCSFPFTFYFGKIAHNNSNNKPRFIFATASPKDTWTPSSLSFGTIVAIVTTLDN